MRHHATWMQTNSGRLFDPADPRAEMIDIDDIAHGLSNLCRFSGQTRWFYSVAEHCERASRAAGKIIEVDARAHSIWVDHAISDRDTARAALLHDAAEAYLVDIPSPVKRLITGYKELEAKLETVICERFGVPLEHLHHPMVKHLDLVMLSTEKRDLFGPPPQPWGELPDPLDQRILARSPFVAAQAWRARFEELFG